MSDFFKDPEYPDRPDHPDFWRLVEAVNYLDGEATEGGRSAEDILGEYIDLDSLDYMADQRIQRTPMRRHPEYRAIVMALYVDGFALGYRTAKEEKDG